MADEYGPEIIFHLVEENKSRKAEVESLRTQCKCNREDIIVMKVKMLGVSIATSAGIGGIVTWMVNRVLNGGAG